MDAYKNRKLGLQFARVQQNRCNRRLEKYYLVWWVLICAATFMGASEFDVTNMKTWLLSECFFIVHEVDCGQLQNNCPQPEFCATGRGEENCFKDDLFFAFKRKDLKDEVWKNGDLFLDHLGLPCCGWDNPKWGLAVPLFRNGPFGLQSLTLIPSASFSY